MRSEMLLPISFRDFFKTTGLALTALVFLGSVEFSASSGGGDGNTSIRGINLSHIPAVSESIFGESEEERDSEARDAIYLLTVNVFLPESIPDRGYLLPDTLEIRHSFRQSLSNPRGPPAI